MIGRETTGWQLILADLALILFLVTLAALAGFSDESVAAKDKGAAMPEIAAAQALYRPGIAVPSMQEWLAKQDIDPRATLTIFGRFTDQDEAEIWAGARSLANEADMADVPVRIMLTPADRSDLYASLAFDAPVQGAGPERTR